jgi:hypothetical protein
VGADRRLTIPVQLGTSVSTGHVEIRTAELPR